MALRGVPGSRRFYELGPGGSDAVTFVGCILDDPPPGEYPQHFWMLTAKGTRELFPPQARPLLSGFVGLHDPQHLFDGLTRSGHDPDGVHRMLRSRWFKRVPGTITPAGFFDTFGGFTLTRGLSEVARPDASSTEILLRTQRSATPVVVPGWLYSHMIGPPLRPDLLESITWKIDDPSEIVVRVTTVIERLPRLLGDGIASLTPARTSSAARLVDAQAYAPAVQRLGPARDEGLDWLIRFLSKV